MSKRLGDITTGDLVNLGIIGTIIFLPFYIVFTVAKILIGTVGFILDTTTRSSSASTTTYRHYYWLACPRCGMNVTGCAYCTQCGLKIQH